MLCSLASIFPQYQLLLTSVSQWVGFFFTLLCYARCLQVQPYPLVPVVLVAFIQSLSLNRKAPGRHCNCSRLILRHDRICFALCGHRNVFHFTTNALCLKNSMQSIVFDISERSNASIIAAHIHDAAPSPSRCGNNGSSGTVLHLVRAKVAWCWVNFLSEDNTRALQHLLPEGNKTEERKWPTFHFPKWGILCLQTEQVRCCFKGYRWKGHRTV